MINCILNNFITHIKNPLHQVFYTFLLDKDDTQEEILRQDFQFDFEILCLQFFQLFYCVFFEQFDYQVVPYKFFFLFSKSSLFQQKIFQRRHIDPHFLHNQVVKMILHNYKAINFISVFLYYVQYSQIHFMLNLNHQMQQFIQTNQGFIQIIYQVQHVDETYISSFFSQLGKIFIFLVILVYHQFYALRVHVKYMNLIYSEHCINSVIQYVQQSDHILILNLDRLKGQFQNQRLQNENELYFLIIISPNQLKYQSVIDIDLYCTILPNLIAFRNQINDLIGIKIKLVIMVIKVRELNSREKVFLVFQVVMVIMVKRLIQIQQL